MENAEVRQMVTEFGDDIKGTLRRNASRQLSEGRLHGYLAFEEETSIGWCNAEGYVAVEGYADVQQDRVSWDFHGPLRLYEKEGFAEMARSDVRIVMRKE
jgi:hypothetical protein